MSEVSGAGAPILPFDWAAAGLSSPAGRSPAAIRAAAEQFEALLVGQMLRSMREAGGGGWLGASEQDASFSLMEMAEQCLATALASQGGLGLARMVEQALAAGESASDGPGSSTSRHGTGPISRSG